VEPIFRRLVRSLDDELNAAAIAAEQRLDAGGIPIKQGDSWILHSDAICQALWSCREIATKTFVALQEHQDGIGSVQWFCTDEESVPFQWLSQLWPKAKPGSCSSAFREPGKASLQ
jgi:hypothetical protein